MAHKYYCTHCARELDQDRVLMDMEYALTVSDDEISESEQKENVQKFQLVKFRVTVQEFHGLIARGTAGDEAYRHIDLSIEELAGYMANERNLKDPAIAGLTLKDIDDYLADRRKNEFGDTGNEAADIFGDFSADDLFGGPAKTEEEKVEEAYVPSEAINALKDRIATAKGENMTERLLEEDLSLLRKLVDENGTIPIAIKARYETADTGDEVLIGYYARRGPTKIVINARRCCHCGTKVFQHAGAAVHKAVAFIGEAASGKTSTILALTNYATRAAAKVLPDDHIWRDSSCIPGIAYMELVGRDPILMKDLELYNIGVAPKKTFAKQREDAYSATLWITNSREQKFILTLIDLPGELCKDDGTIDSNRILDEFPVAMASDVFIMCFDTERAGGYAAAETINRTCSWASYFQDLRYTYKKDTMLPEAVADQKPGPVQVRKNWWDRFLPVIPGQGKGNTGAAQRMGKNCVAPMIVVFTKCGELESGEAEQQAERNYFNPKRVDEVYSLKVEREFIDRNPVYQEVGRRIQIYENLKYAYIARLRTSPYGFAAPNKPQYLEDNSVNKNLDGSIRYPKPKHVADLMHWLMVITGVVPAPAVFVPNAAEPDRVYRLNDTYVKRPQYRVWDPQGETYKERVDEAMCRAYLFENYSDVDKGYIENYDDKSWHP